MRSRAFHRTPRAAGRSAPALIPPALIPLALAPLFLIPLALLLLTAASPDAAFAQRSRDLRNTQHMVITVTLKNGDRVTLRSPQFGSRRGGERPGRGRGSAPPGMPTGPDPGNAPGGFGDPGEGPGAGVGPGSMAPADPRDPTRRSDGTRRRPYLPGSGISPDEMRLVRRIDIVRVERGVTYGDFTYKNGDFRPDKPMQWDALAGWERPGQQGKSYYFYADEIRSLEFPDY